MSAAGTAPVAPAVNPLRAFEGRIQLPPVSPAYRAALLLVACAMVLLPVLYAGFVGLTAYGVYYHAVHHLSWLAGGGLKLRLVLYAFPIVVGSILVVFLIKPFFARRVEAAAPLVLDRRREGLLFAYVEKLCRTVGAPAPARIHVNCDVNASAGHLGIVSLVNGELVLTIGLPLVAGMSLRQFSGVLAHEFGHFSQGTGMRVSNLIRRVNVWLARVVYERDDWDAMLVSWCDDGRDGYVMAVGYLARFFVWISRGILWVLMMAGHAVSSLLMRQMEFDADRYEIRLAGSETFASTALQLRVLSAATQLSYEELSATWREGRLAADLPSFIAARTSSLPGPLLSALKNGMAQDQTGWFDTHPCDRERIERARTERQSGIFRMEAPATVLFRRFEEVAREATLQFYRGTLGDRVSEANLVGNQVIEGVTEEQDAAERVLGRYTGGVIDADPPFFLGAPAAGPARAEALAPARQSFEAALPPAQAALDKLRKADDMLRGAELAARLLQANARIEARTFNLPTASAEGVERARRRALEMLEASRGPVEAARTALQSRWLSSLALLSDPRWAAAVPDGAVLAARVARELDALAALERTFGQVLTLRDRVTTVAALAGHIETNPELAALPAQIQALQPALHGVLHAIRDALGRTPYPFEHTVAHVSVGEYALSEVPEVSDLGGLFNASQELLGNLFTLHRRLLGRLATVAEQVESAAGMAPLPEPPRA